ncbi:MAG: DUF4411 family protein [Anaerolineae bacterium]|nr:DUF4411 family protein [Anaerolineae bacterium]
MSTSNLATPAPTHVLDTSVFTQAHRLYYPHEICPGFWECLSHHAASGRLSSIDRVQKEITDGKDDDDVKHWAKNSILRPFFAKTDTTEVATQFAEMMRWVQAETQFRPEAKAEFAQVADGWVVAYAKVNGLTVVSQEVFAADSRKRVPLPNVCVLRLVLRTSALSTCCEV